MCVLGLRFWLPPGIPGWGVGVCVFVCALCLYPTNPGWVVRCGCACLGSGCGCAPLFLAELLGCVFGCACSTRTPPILAGVCGVGVCPPTRVWLPPAVPG